MKNNLKPIYARAFAALVERFEAARQVDKAAALKSGELTVMPAVYYFRRKLSTSITKYLQDWTQNRVAGITNLVDGRFPQKMTAAFSHIGIAYGYSATSVAASAIKYSNNLYVPTTTGEATVNTRNYPVEADLLDTDVLNSEVTIGVGDITLFNRFPMSTFFKQARYQTDDQARGGVMSIENAYELAEAVTCTESNAPSFELTWNDAASLTDHTYLEVSFHGLEVVVR